MTGAAASLFIDSFYFALGAFVVIAGVLAAAAAVVVAGWFVFQAGQRFYVGFLRGWRS